MLMKCSLLFYYKNYFFIRLFYLVFGFGCSNKSRICLYPLTPYALQIGYYIRYLGGWWRRASLPVTLNARGEAWTTAFQWRCTLLYGSAHWLHVGIRRAYIVRREERTMDKRTVQAYQPGRMAAYVQGYLIADAYCDGYGGWLVTFHTRTSQTSRRVETREQALHAIENDKE